MAPIAEVGPENPGTLRGAKPGDPARDAWLRALTLTSRIEHDPGLTLPIQIERKAEQQPDAVALIGESGCWSYRQLAGEIRHYANWAVGAGVGRGEVVALLMRNCPDYIAIWLGITRMGGVVALVNSTLVGDSLVHAIATVAPAHLIVGIDLWECSTPARAALRGPLRVWLHGGDHPPYPRIDAGPSRSELPTQSSTISDTALYIYTSGTTGLPKAATVSHRRLMQWSLWFAGMMDARPTERMYDCLPMYHSVGGVVAPCAMLVSGGSVVIRQQFSARRFWDDVAATECTVFQYIGELCRYLVSQPPHPRERMHALRLSCGNGLRPEVWQAFRRRFAIAQNLEFYAATEANFSLYNCDDEPGSIGRIPPFLAHRFPLALIELDPETGEPRRGDDGHCNRCGSGEVGEAIARITGRRSSAGVPFEGYTDPAASKKKVLRDVFEPGDAWFRSGDLMRQDRRGYFYFVDRVGDTFRWKGENVSTTQVAEALSACPGVNEAVVYGVAVPGADGRAGMAAIVTDDGFAIAGLWQHVRACLPDCARPRFVRLCDAIELTATFKQKKQGLIGQGYDPSATTDPIYVDDGSGFCRLDPRLYRQVNAGAIRL